ncbi:MAG TPA: plasmid partition protein ParG [Acidobacteriaceae bacterium]|nr:plasmid partition protein ParG [Acidobacteriaceae bacterium]
MPSQPEITMKRMNLNVPVELHNRFKSVTAGEGQNMTDVLLDFIESYVASHRAKPKKPRH